MTGLEILIIFVGLIVGIIFVYLIMPKKRILKYPSIANPSKTTYIDNRDVCYKYYIKNVPCQ